MQKEDVLKELDKFYSKSDYTLENIYLFGSRVYGTAKADSDWDLICIVSGQYFPGPKLIENEALNVNFYHQDYFQTLLDENVIWGTFFNFNEVVVQNLYLPKDCVWLENVKFQFRMRKICLKKATIMDADHNFNKAKRAW